MRNDEYLDFEQKLNKLVFEAAFADNWKQVERTVRLLKEQVYAAYELGCRRERQNTQKARDTSQCNKQVQT